MVTEFESAAAQHRGRLVAVFGITVAILLVEVIGGIVSGSLALLADAGHALTDVAGIGLALGAIWFAARPSSAGRTFGFYRAEILVAVINGVLLFGVAGLVLVEAWRRFASPPEVEGGVMIAAAAVGLAGNLVSVWLLREGQSRSLTMRGAYLEVMGDVLGSLAVLVAAGVLAITGWPYADPIASVLVGLLILPRTWRLLREAVDVLMEATPRGIDLDEVRRHITETPGVADAHDLHAWTITNGLNVVSAHVVLGEGADSGIVLDRLMECLRGDFDIEHSTFQLEPATHQGHEPSMHP
jgi:cobalt-zinc-cadmium efflux system protein